MSQADDSTRSQISRGHSMELEDSNNDVQITDRLFDKFPSHCTIKQRIEFSVLRYKNNYYVGKTLAELEEVPIVCRPVQKVTKELVKKFVNYQEKAVKKKLAWVLDNIKEPYSSDFKAKFDSNDFKSVKEAELLAARIYRHNCTNYQTGKAMVTSVDGQMKIRASNNERDAHREELKRMFYEQLQQNSDKFQQAVNLKMHGKGDSVNFDKLVFKNEVINLQQRIGVNCLSIVHQIMENL